MRFLADESCDFAAVQGLRAAGHDVRALAEETSRTVDREVMALAAREHRILLTEDKDFGWLAYVGGEETEGVILIRFPGNARRTLGDAVKDLVAEYGDRLMGCFAVLEPGQTRIGPRPPGR